MKKQFYIFNQLKNILTTQFPEVDKAIKSYEKQNSTKISKII